MQLWQRNYRQGDVGAIITSIRTFGFNGALRVWRDDVIIAGNHTLKALAEMKRQQEDAPHGVMVSASGDWVVACVDVSHLSDTEAQAFAIADNRTTELADNDEMLLHALLSDVALEDGTLLNATGYDGDDIDAMIHASVIDSEVVDALSSNIKPPAQRSLSNKVVKPALALAEVELFERAMALANEPSRSAALIKICKTYIDYAG